GLLGKTVKTAVACLAALTIAAMPASSPGQERSAPPMDEAIERQPYRILFYLGCDPFARIDERLRIELLRRWQVLARRFVGAPWVVTLAEPGSPLGNVVLEAADPAAFAGLGQFDKVWVARVTRSEVDSTLALSGREYDSVTRRVGPLQRRTIPSLSDA